MSSLTGAVSTLRAGFFTGAGLAAVLSAANRPRPTNEASKARNRATGLIFIGEKVAVNDSSHPARFRNPLRIP